MSIKVKRYLVAVFIIALAVLGITARVYCYQAEVVDISGTKYFPAVKEALAKAQKSIYLVMFTIQLSSSVDEKRGQSQNSGQSPFSKVGQLIDALIEAKKRGVEVEVILDQNVDFVHRRHPSDWDVEIKSARAFKRLKDAGIKVYYDEPARYTHCKTVIIDKKIVILGSTNWTESAFSNSIETNLLVNSAELADEILSYLKTIKIDESTGKNLEVSGPSTPIDRDFLENPGLAPKMLRESAVRDFDVYLYLLWKQRDSPQKAGTVPFSYEDTAKYLGIYGGWTATDYRRQIIRVLRNLERKYKLIKFEPSWGKEAVVTLVEIASPPQILAGRNDTKGAISRNDTGIPASAGMTPTNDASFELTNDYFNFGWNRELTLRAKFCLLINLYYFQMSDVKPFWSESIPDITKQFGRVGREVIIKGMDELRRKKVIEVRYDELRGKPFDIKSPKRYKLLKLYDPKEVASKLKAIEDKYDRQDFTKARRYAQIVFEENNPQVIEDIILKTKQYGAQKIKKAFDIVGLKNTDNPKKSYRYVVGIIENK